MSIRRASSSRGFTLIEVLIALAIASVLVPAITRLVGNTRSGAVAVVANVHAMRIAQAMLDRFADDPKVATGRYSGKEEGYHWQVDVQSTPYTVRTIVSAPPKEAAPEQKGADTGAKADTNAPRMELGKVGEPASRKPAPKTDWTLVRITAVVQSPTRRSAVLETVRLRQGPGPNMAQR